MLGPLAPGVDPEAHRAREDLRQALQAAFPKKATPNGEQAIKRCKDAPPQQHAGPGDARKEEHADRAGDPATRSSAGLDKLQEGLERLNYLSGQPTELRTAWSIEKAHQLHQEGNTLFREGGWQAAAAKYRSALDLIGVRADCPPAALKAHDDLTVLCASNLAACALKAGDAREALALCDTVLALDPSHSKARFRRVQALVRRRSQHVAAVAQDGELRWAAPRSAPSGGAHASSSRRPAPGRDQREQEQPLTPEQRAADLLEAQRELEDICRRNPRDNAVRKFMEELYLQAKTEEVHLRPTPWLFPKGLRDFEYLHCQDPVSSPSACSSSSSAPAGGAGGSTPRVAHGVPGRERNLMVFLHGFGGRKDSFVTLAEALALPQTACLILNAPDELPDEILDDPPGFGWFDMLDEDACDFITSQRGDDRRLASLEECGEMLAEMLEVLTGTFAWKDGEVFFLGYGQGGTAALDLLLRPHLGTQLRAIGGVLGVATEVLPERLWQGSSVNNGGKSWPEEVEPPHVLLVHGEADRMTAVPAALASAQRLRAALLGPSGASSGPEGDRRVQLEVFPGRGGEMLRGGHAEEMQCVMQFLSDHLHGVGRRGSEEAMRRMGAEPVADVELTELD